MITTAPAMRLSVVIVDIVGACCGNVLTKAEGGVTDLLPRQE